VIGRGKVSAEPHEWRLHFFRHSDHVGIEAIDIVGGHERDLIKHGDGVAFD
jgi:hypothetical protein